MRWHRSFRGAVVIGLVWLVIGCSSDEDANRVASREEPAPPAESASASQEAPTDESSAEQETTEPPRESTAPPTTSQSDADVAEPPAEPASEPTPVQPPTREEPPEPAPEPTPEPEPTPQPEIPSAPEAERPPSRETPTPATPVAPASVTDSAGEVVAVPATKPGLTYIGAAKCKMCHKVQYASWSTSAHAERTPPLDCEACHGPGSEYKKLSIMKDPELAKAAGLVTPEKSFCTGACHQDNWQDDMLVQAHAHKTDAP